MSEPLTVGSLFSGIGGLELGLERAGMRTVWQVESDPYARRILAKHWPDVRRHDDVRTFPPGDHDAWRCDLICGGFPCQDISLCGKGAGLDGNESSLWFEYLRILRLLRPRFAIVENSPGLFVRGIERVLGGLAESGFDAEWSTLSACEMGAPHMRKRLFLVAHAEGERWQWGRDQRSGEAKNGRCSRESQGRVGRPDWSLETRPPIERVVARIPDRMDRLRCLGNAVVPQVAEFIGRLIMDHEFAQRSTP